MILLSHWSRYHLGHIVGCSGKHAANWLQQGFFDSTWPWGVWQQAGVDCQRNCEGFYDDYHLNDFFSIRIFHH